MEYFEALSQLLKIEKHSDQKQYTHLISNSSISQKREKGLVWYPVAIRNQELGRGDYLTVEFERTTHQNHNHQFKFGSPVGLFSNHDDHEYKLEGTVTHQSLNKIRIAFKTDELPEWSSKGKLGLELQFDNNSYNEMFEALKKASSSPLAPYLLGQSKPTFNESIFFKENLNLNESQNKAIERITHAQQLAIVHGPPGTGKTTTLVEGIVNLSKNGKILVTAPSNTAVDLLSQKISEKNLNVLRIGNFSRISDALDEMTIEGKMAKHPEFKNIRKLKIQANEYRSLAHKYKRNFGKAERDQRKALFDEAHKLLNEVTKLEDYIVQDSIDKADVITATLVGSNHHTIKNLKFHAVIIDEAAQALEPACWIPILKTDKVILAGDHCQLPPTIKTENSTKSGLGITLFEKLTTIHPESVTLLEVQYRMNEEIMEFPSKIFYNKQLKAFQANASLKLHDGLTGVQFIDTAGSGYEEKNISNSIINEDEAKFLVTELESTIIKVAKNYSFGIISPYSQQIKILKSLIENSEILKKHNSQITVNTIDSFQGQERDAVFISLVRSNDDSNIGFLADTRRMNVAMTRAKRHLWVIGDSSTICTNEFYDKFVNHTQKNNQYKSIWEFNV